MKRRPMGYKQSKKVFRRGNKTHKKNFQSAGYISRGGAKL